MGGLKRKWKHCMQRFDSTKSKYSHLFWVVVLLINFLHMKCINLTYEVIGDQDVNWTPHSWARDF
jgi:hypothetical protein